MLPTNRGLLKYIIFNFITLGIYNLFFIHGLARDTNIACEGDNKNTMGILAFLLLSFITFGIFSLIWWICIVVRVDNTLTYKYKQKSAIGILGFLAWYFIGSLIIIGPFIAIALFLHNMNCLCDAHNKTQPVLA